MPYQNRWNHAAYTSEMLEQSKEAVKTMENINQTAIREEIGCTQRIEVKILDALEYRKIMKCGKMFYKLV